MASEAECEKALRTLVTMLAGVDAETRGKYVQERTVSVKITDLDIVWSARLNEDGLRDLTTEDDAKAQLRLSVSSDDLIALVEGRLAVASAVAIGKLRVQASPMDLLRLTNLI